jgi:hypothetical protein
MSAAAARTASSTGTVAVADSAVSLLNDEDANATLPSITPTAISPSSPAARSPNRWRSSTDAPSPIGFDATTSRFAADSAESPSNSRLSAIHSWAAATGSLGSPVAR